jgi:hypothetical protein
MLLMGASGWGAPGPSGRCPETSDGHVHPRRRNVQLARERVSALAHLRRSRTECTRVFSGGWKHRTCFRLPAVQRTVVSMLAAPPHLPPIQFYVDFSNLAGEILRRGGREK